MPAYDFKCPSGHTNEHFISASAFTERVPCSDCEQEATYFPSFYYTRSAQPVPPTVIHRDAAGNVRFASPESKPPAGFERVELRNSYEVHKFENEVNARDRVTAQKFHNSQTVLREGQLKENRRVMDHLKQKFTPRGRRFYDAMRDQSEKRTHSSVKPEFYVEAYSMDASNREDYHDPTISFGRGRK